MKFTYHGAELDGFDHPHNTTILNERAIEIPVALRWLQGVSNPGLEVGNVLGHYGVHGHTVVDKYEEAPGVRNIDVLSIDGLFGWVVSISTLEHVGRDEESGDMGAAILALDHLRTLLTPTGSMLVTIPGGHHPPLDQYLSNGAHATRDCTLIRDGETWRQTEQRTFLPYGGTTTRWANSVWVGEFTGSRSDDR